MAGINYDKVFGGLRQQMQTLKKEKKKQKGNGKIVNQIGLSDK